MNVDQTQHQDVDEREFNDTARNNYVHHNQV